MEITLRFELDGEVKEAHWQIDCKYLLRPRRGRLPHEGGWPTDTFDYVSDEGWGVRAEFGTRPCPREADSPVTVGLDKPLEKSFGLYVNFVDKVSDPRYFEGHRTYSVGEPIPIGLRWAHFKPLSVEFLPAASDRRDLQPFISAEMNRVLRINRGAFQARNNIVTLQAVAYPRFVWEAVDDLAAALGKIDRPRWLEFGENEAWGPLYFRSRQNLSDGSHPWHLWPPAQQTPMVSFGLDKDGIWNLRDFAYSPRSFAVDIGRNARGEWDRNFLETGKYTKFRAGEFLFDLMDVRDKIREVPGLWFYDPGTELLVRFYADNRGGLYRVFR